MFGIENLGLFMLSGLLLNMMPGPDSVFILARSAKGGFRAGSMAAMGIGAGTFVHIFAAAFGLAALMATSAMAFTVIKWIGAGYLLYLGLSTLFASKQQTAITQDVLPASMAHIFYQGFLTNSLNPKVALFFLAFVPQFISPEAENKALAFIVLGLVFNINGMLWCHILAWSSSTLSKKLKASQRVSLWLNRLTGCLFLGFGLRLALDKQAS